MYNVKVMVPEQQRVQSVTILLSSKYKKTYKTNKYKNKENKNKNNNKNNKYKGYFCRKTQPPKPKI